MQLSEPCSDLASALHGYRIAGLATAGRLQACRILVPLEVSVLGQVYLAESSSKSDVSLWQKKWDNNIMGSRCHPASCHLVWLRRWTAFLSLPRKEYARDENTGGAYDGLFAVLLCRVVVGSSYVVQKPGDYREARPLLTQFFCGFLHSQKSCSALHGFFS